MFPDLYITGKEEASLVLTHPRWGSHIQHLCSIGEEHSLMPFGYRDERLSTMRIEFDDIERASHLWYQPCMQHHVEPMLRLAARVKEQPAPVLVHCAAGISRSTATALVLLAALSEPGQEKAALDHLLASVQNTYEKGLRADLFIRPNRRVVWWGDQLLNREGALLELVQRSFAYHDVFEP